MVVLSNYSDLDEVVDAGESPPPDSMLHDCIGADCIVRRCNMLAGVARLIDGIGDEPVLQNAAAA